MCVKLVPVWIIISKVTSLNLHLLCSAANFVDLETSPPLLRLFKSLETNLSTSWTKII